MIVYPLVALRAAAILFFIFQWYLVGASGSSSMWRLVPVLLLIVFVRY